MQKAQTINKTRTHTHTQEEQSHFVSDIYPPGFSRNNKCCPLSLKAPFVPCAALGHRKLYINIPSNVILFHLSSP